MARLLLNARVFKLIVFAAHFLLVVLIFGMFTQLNLGEAPRIAKLDPVAAIYVKASLNWIGIWREAAAFIVFIFDVIVGVMLVRFGLRRTHEVARYFMVGIGSQLIFSGILSLTMLGHLIWGGLWHLASAIVAAAMGGSALITFSMLLLFWESLNTLGEKQDKALQERQDTK